MYKRLLLGVLLSYTTIFYCSSNEHLSSRNQMQTPPMARMTHQKDHFDDSLADSSRLESPYAATNAQSSPSCSPALHNGSFSNSARNSSVYLSAAAQSQSPIRPNSTEDINDEGCAARPTTPVYTADEELLKMHAEITAACLTKFSNNLKIAAQWEEEQRNELAYNDEVSNHMRNPDLDEDCQKMAEQLMQQEDLAKRCGIGNSPTYTPEKSGQHRPTPCVVWKAN